MLTRDTMLKLKPLEDNGEVTDWGRYGHNYTYDSLINTMPVIVLAWSNIGDYQGDSLVLLRGEDGMYGYMVFGYGSCSGCDWLEACNSIEEINGLRQEMFDSIQWGTKEEIVEYFRGKDWAAEWYHNANEINKFLDKCGACLGVVFSEISKERK